LKLVEERVATPGCVSRTNRNRCVKRTLRCMTAATSNLRLAFEKNGEHLIDATRQWFVDARGPVRSSGFSA
jgi:hypothetical protein